MKNKGNNNKNNNKKEKEEVTEWKSRAGNFRKKLQEPFSASDKFKFKFWRHFQRYRRRRRRRRTIFK